MEAIRADSTSAETRPIGSALLAQPRVLFLHVEAALESQDNEVDAR